MCTLYLLEYFQNNQYSVLTRVLFLSTHFIPGPGPKHHGQVAPARWIKQHQAAMLPRLCRSANKFYEAKKKNRCVYGLPTDPVL